MKKYKIIQPYPGSENLGVELERSQIPNRIINDPLFDRYYKEIIEKDYEILCIKKVSGKNHVFFEEWTPENNRNISLKAMLNIGHCVNSKDYYIHSVKRLSDGEVFTIGDFVKENITGQCKGWEIKEFSLKDSRCFSCGVNINNIEKLKEVLFKTEDGVDIYEGDIYWNVNILFNIKKCKVIKNSTTLEYKIFNNLNDNKIFSTKEAAQDYIESKKALFKTEDGVDIYEGDTYWWVNTNFWKAQKEKITNIRQYNAQETGYNVGGNFSTKEAAEEYILLNKPCLSYGDVQEFLKIKDCNKVLNLVKDRNTSW